MSEIRRTAAQVKAIESVDASVCVRAGAGTGKTFVLVGRYMELLRRRKVESVREIAALTYTEKAAKEMKDRIRRECLREEEAATGDGARWWRRQRVDLETAHVGTLHGFCASLLAEHPVEAGVDPQFVMLDEVAQFILGERAMDDVLRRELDADSPGVMDLCRASGLSGVRGMLDAMTSNRAEADRAADALEGVSDEGALARVRERLDQLQADYLAGMLDEAESTGLVATLRETKCTDPKDKAEVRRTEALRILGELARVKDAGVRVRLAAELRDALATLSGGSKAKWPDDGLPKVQEACKSLRAMLDGVPGEEFGRKVGDLDKTALKHARVLARLYREVIVEYAKAKAAGGCLDFEDLLLRAHALLETNAAVRRRVREKIRFLLVDELQDSALIDREILMLLARDEADVAHPPSGADVSSAQPGAATLHNQQQRSTPGGGSATCIAPGRLFVVGDDKQSIYRFRGAEVTVFRDLADLLKEQGEVVDLDVNFRTVPRGVAFANDFFGRLLGHGEKKRPWENRYLDLSAKRAEDAPFLEALIPEPDPANSAADAREREARLVAARIREMVGNGEKLAWDAEAKAFRPVAFGDVAVLFRAMTSVDRYERALREAGVPYYILGGSGFYRAQEILDLLTALKALERPRDPVALMGTLRSPLFGISDETLFFMSRRGSVRAGLEEAESVEEISPDQRSGLVAARGILRDLAAVKNRVTISRLIEETLRRTGFDALLLAQFMGRQKLANVEKLVDVARAFEAKGLFTLDDFLRYIEEFVAVEGRESERAAEEETSNVVRLMSVHRAKGLEFPVVFAADLAHERRRGEPPVALDRALGVAVSVEDDDGERPLLYDLIQHGAKLRDEAEDLRVLYVALTRARDHLVLAGALPRGAAARGTWLRMLLDAYDLLNDGKLAPALVFGAERYEAPVRSTVPEPPEVEEQGRRHAGWKVVQRLDRLVARVELVHRVPDFEGRRHVEPLALDLTYKRRFVASEFTEYCYCPQRHYLSRVLGVLPADVGRLAADGKPDGLSFGTLVHRVLASWDFRAATLDETLARVMMGSGQGRTDADETVRAEASRLIRAAHRAGLFESAAAAVERRGEYPVAARVADFVVEGVIDGVHTLRDGSVEVVDYKTDRVEGRETPALAEHYELQIACYALALVRAGLRVSKASLLFLRPARRHDWSCTPEQLADWERKVVACVRNIRDGKFDERRTGSCRCAHAWTCERKADGAQDLDLV